METKFVAHLIPGVAAVLLPQDEADRVKMINPLDQRYPNLTQNCSFVYVDGPNCSVSVTANGRFVVAIVGQYSIPGSPASPADWVLHAYEKHSSACFENINGSWRLLLLDTDAGTATIATDRMGSQRICYSIGDGGQLTIGHSSDAVSRVRDSSLTISTDSILRYFYFHCIPSPNTLFDEIQSLPPAEALIWSRDNCERRRYWKPRFAEDRSMRGIVKPADLLDTLDNAVRSACSSARTATFLSGGLDSSTVLGLAFRHFPGSVTPYTIGFDEPEYDETGYARIAADSFGASLVRYEVTPDDVVDTISTIAESYDEPFGNSSAIPTFFCAKAAAAAGETTILAGDGGDELFAGNERYRTQQIFSHYDKLPAVIRSHLLEPIFLKSLASTGFYPIRKIRRYIEQARLPMPDRLQTYNFLSVHGTVNIFSAQFLDAVDAASPLQHLRSVYAEADTECLIDRMLYLDWKLTLADNDLRKVTTMCEQAGINVRYPMLDNSVIDISCKIPGSVKMRRGNLRDFFKTSVRALLPEQILNKSKHGFGLPFGPWFAKSQYLRNHMLEILDNFGQRGIVNPDYIELVRKATVGEHPGYYGEMIWLMCVFESWLSARPEWRSYRL